VPASFDDVEIGDDSHVVVVTGELDLTTVGELRRRIDAALASGCSRVVVDLSDTIHMDSSGLAELLAAHQRAQAAGGGLALVVTTQSLRRTLRIRGVDGLFTVEPTRAGALAAIG